MTTPTLSNDWYSRGNIPYPNTTTLMDQFRCWPWLLKALLKGEVSTGTTASVVSGVVGNTTRPAGSYWTCEGSCDGNGNWGLDGVDRWTSSYDATKLIGDADGADHSWIVLKSPAALGPVYLCIDWCRLDTEALLLSGNGGHLTLVFSYSAFTGGSATTRPVGGGATSNEWEPSGAAVTVGNVETVYETVPGYQTFYAHFTITPAGAFHFATNRIPTNVFLSHFFCTKAAETQTGDNYPVWIGFHSSIGSSRGGGTVALRSRVSARTYDNTSYTPPGMLVNNFGSVSEFISLKDVLALKWRLQPLYLYDQSAWRGRLPDMYAVPNDSGSGRVTLQVGSCYPATTAPTHHVVGDYLVPFGVPPKL